MAPNRVAVGGAVALATVTAALRASKDVPAGGAPSPLAQVGAALRDGWELVRPGGTLHPAAFLEHHGIVALEALLVVTIAWLLLQKSSKPRGVGGVAGEPPLTQAEEEALLAEWEPEPLVPPPGSAASKHGGRGARRRPSGAAEGDGLAAALASLLRASPAAGTRGAPAETVVESRRGTRAVVAGREAIDTTAADYLGLSGDARIEQACLESIAQYGVGSCGPRGFYGTFDVHLELESSLAKHMGAEEAILYSYDAATFPSIIPPFANARDLIILDDGVAWPILSGAYLSRAEVLTFAHNDAGDLERVLESVAARDRARPPKRLNRRFIVVEGIYAKTGDLAPLARIAELKDRYKYRLVVDESHAIGVLGEKGRGALEAAGLPADAADIVGASLSNAVASIGGFCSGSREVVDHQRLAGLGYCFSASQPPYTAVAATKALEIMAREGAGRRATLASRAKRLRQRLSGGEPPSATGPAPPSPRALIVVPDAAGGSSPLVHIRLSRPLGPDAYEAGDAALQRVVDAALTDSSVLLATSKYSMLERNRPPPSIKVHVSAAHTEDDIDAIAAAILRAADKVLA